MRSPVTRAVAGLLLITSDFKLRVQNLRRNWEVEILEKGVRLKTVKQTKGSEKC